MALEGIGHFSPPFPSMSKYNSIDSIPCSPTQPHPNPIQSNPIQPDASPEQPHPAHSRPKHHPHPSIHLLHLLRHPPHAPPTAAALLPPSLPTPPPRARPQTDPKATKPKPSSKRTHARTHARSRNRTPARVRSLTFIRRTERENAEWPPRGRLSCVSCKQGRKTSSSGSVSGAVGGVSFARWASKVEKKKEGAQVTRDASDGVEFGG